MAFTAVNSSGKIFVVTRKWKEFTEGEYLVGILEECEEKDKFKKPIFAIKVSESNFKHPTGTNIYLNCGGNFLNDMNTVETGEKIKISFNGKTKIKSGDWKGSDTYVIKVEIDSATSANEDLI